VLVLDQFVQDLQLGLRKVIHAPVLVHQQIDQLTLHHHIAHHLPHHLVHHLVAKVAADHRNVVAQLGPLVKVEKEKVKVADKRVKKKDVKILKIYQHHN
jgi:uncharacterized protein (DUF2249 family)